MIELAAERAAGTHQYFVTADSTRLARERLGPGALVAPEVACVVERDPVRARAVARDYAELYLGLSNYTRPLLDSGFTERDLADGGSDRLIDAVIPQGSPSRSPRRSAPISTPAPITCASSRSARRASPASRGRRSRRR